ncbi:MAG: orotidine-5'-phosphate decarboxylase [Elusimicrobia bacterium]|nr:orotidine-5'-phosphate decarboxylase [Elusimicrobiota bacterium]
MTEVIVALDVDTLKRAEELLKRLKGEISFYKVGLQLFTAHGRRAVELVQRHGGKVFLDLKLMDIPQTVAHAVEEAQKLGVESVSLHLLGGSDMVAAAAKVKPRPELWGVTALTSLRAGDFRRLGLRTSLPALVNKLARVGLNHGADGIICSALEVPYLRRSLKNLSPNFITPGIRPAGTDLQDQKRVMTPGRAARLGIGRIVVGRPITGASDPAKAARDILEEIAAARK